MVIAGGGIAAAAAAIRLRAIGLRVVLLVRDVAPVPGIEAVPIPALALFDVLGEAGVAAEAGAALGAPTCGEHMTTLATRPPVVPRRSRSAPSHSLRPDIQGLRAVAVVLVILSHLTGWPSGGFIGVDVFFVISGFLITGLLLREHARTGRISFVDFYRRRVRRILPVAMLVLLVTVVASYLTFFGSRARETLADALWSSLFAANARFALIGTDYQHAGDAPSPLQHFWSLAVEEQYYVVWPLLLVAALAWAAKRAGAGTRSFALPVLVVAVTVASLAWALWETRNNPTVAYFSTASRAWELSTGAALAVFSGRLQRLRMTTRTWLAWTGLGGIAASAFLITSSSPFPAPWALLPVLATAAVIAAGTGPQAPRLAPLDNAPMAYVGDISYSLYLWHWPVIVLAGTVLPDGPGSVAVTVGLIVALSMLSYHCVEDPIRKSPWLDRSARSRPASRTTYFPRQSQVATVMAVCVFATALASYTVLRNPAPAHSAPAAPPLNAEAATGSTAAEEAVSEAQALLGDGVRTALASTTWPELTPSLDELARHRATEWQDDGCLGSEKGALADPQANAARCVYGSPDADKTAVLLGDSIAISYLPGIRAALEPHGWKIQVYTMRQCPAATVTVKAGEDTPHPQCDPFREWALTQIAAQSPDLVIVSSSRGRLEGPGDGSSTGQRWRTGLDATLDRLVDAAARTVLLSPPPGGAGLADCATRTGVPWDCVRAPTPSWRAIVQSEAEAASAHGDTVTAVETSPWFCSPEGWCPGFIGTTPVYVDGAHLTHEYALQLAPVLEPVLLGGTATS